MTEFRVRRGSDHSAALAIAVLAIAVAVVFSVFSGIGRSVLPAFGNTPLREAPQTTHSLGLLELARRALGLDAISLATVRDTTAGPVLSASAAPRRTEGAATRHNARTPAQRGTVLAGSGTNAATVTASDRDGSAPGGSGGSSQPGGGGSGGNGGGASNGGDTPGGGTGAGGGGSLDVQAPAGGASVKAGANASVSGGASAQAGASVSAGGTSAGADGSVSTDGGATASVSSGGTTVGVSLP